MRAIRTKLGNEAHWGSGVSFPLNQDHLGSRIGISLTCDYSVLHSHHGYDSFKTCSRVKTMGETKNGPLTASCLYQCHTENEWKWKKGEREKDGGEEEGGSHFIVIQEAPGEEHYDSARPLDMAALLVLNQSQRLQLMAKIRNNHRLPLIILN